MVICCCKKKMFTGMTIFRRMISLFFVLLSFALLSAMPCGAADFSLSALTPEKRTVRIGYYLFDGFFMTDARGQRSGYGYDYLQELRNLSNWTYQYSDPKFGWSEMLPMLRDGKIDMLPGVTKTPERELEFAFSKYPLVKTSSVMTVKAGNKRYLAGNYEKWNGIRVGLLKNTTQSEDFFRFAARKNFSFHPVWFYNPENLTTALLEGKDIDAAVTSTLRNIRGNEWICEELHTSNMYIAVRKKDVALLEELDRAMEQLELQQPDLQRRLRRIYYMNGTAGISAFSEQERAFLERMKISKHVFTCIMNPDRKPFSWFKDGEFHGIFKEYADRISKTTGLVFRFVPVRSRAEYIKKRKQPDIDIVFDIIADYQAAENAGFRLTMPYYSVSVSMLRNRNAGGSIHTMSVLVPGDLENQTHVRKTLLKQNIAIRKCSSIDELVETVKNASSDVAYLYTKAAEYVIYEDELNSLVSTYIPNLEYSFAIGVRNRVNPLAFSVLNKAVAGLDDSFEGRVRAQYSPRVKEVFSVRGFVRRYPVATVGFPVFLFLLFVFFMGYVFYRRKEAWRTGVLFGKLPLRCFVMNSKGEFLYYSLGPMSALSWGPVMKHIDDIPDETVRNIMRNKLASVLKSGKTEMTEVLLNDHYRSVVVSKLPDSVFGADTVLWISQDITELHESRDEIRKHEAFFHLTLDSIGDGVMTTDEEGNILLLNPVAERLIGISCDEAKGRKHEEIFRIVSAIDGKTVASPLRKALASGKIVELGNHTDLLAFDGQKYHIADSAGPIRSENGEIIGAVLIFRDVTETYRQREELRASLSNWEAASDVANLCSYRVNVRTREEFSNLKRLNTLWPIVDGKALPMDDWVEPEDLPEVKRTFMEFRDGRRKDFIITFRAKRGGTVRHYRMFGRMEGGESPDIMTGLVQDVTELFEAMDALRKTSRMWKLVMDELPVLFFVKDADKGGRYLMCNKMNADFLGLPGEQVIGRTSREIIRSGNELETYLESEQRILMDNSIDRTRINIPGADGYPREMEKIEMVVSGVNGKKLLVGIAFDITEQEQNLRLSAISAKILSEIVIESDFNKVLDIVGKTAIDNLSCRRVVFARAGDDGQLHFLRECSKDGDLHFRDARMIMLHERLWNNLRDKLIEEGMFSYERMGDDPVLADAFHDYPEYMDKALAAMPVTRGDKLTGIILIAFSTPRRFSKIEKKMFRAVADALQIASIRAIQNEKILLSRQEEEKQLAERTVVNSALNVFLNSDYMHVPFEPILEIIRAHLGASYCFVIRCDMENELQTCQAEATGNGLEKILEGKPAMPFDRNAPWLGELERNGTVAWSASSIHGTLGELDNFWTRIATEHSIRSLWVSGLKTDGKMWGTLGIAYDEHAEMPFSMEKADFVASAGRLVALILMRCRSRDRLSEALEQAKSAEKAKSYFLASMSHEIRTPLNAVIGFTELMKNSAMDFEERKECLENIYSSGNALLQLINDVLDLSKMEAGQMRIIPEYTDFPNFCHEVCRPFQYSAGKKLLNLLVRVPEKMPPLMLDQLRMRQILFNLVGNAIKFTKEGSVRVLTEFTQTSAFEGALLLQIADTGIGISEADQKKIFEPFVQLSKMRGTNASNSGTGLGLVIVRKLVEKMGGTMTLESEEGKGTTFSILFPQIVIAGEADANENPKMERDQPVLPKSCFSEKSDLSQQSFADGLRILIVDDIPMNIRILETMLKRLKVNVEKASSGDEALEKMKTGKFDWVFTDLVMPGMNGAELAGKIRENPEYNGVKLAVITADRDRIEFDKNLFAAVLGKPIGISDLQKYLYRSCTP